PFAWRDTVDRVSVVQVSQAFRDRRWQFLGSRALAEIGVDERRQAPALDLLKEALPVGTTLQQMPNALNVGIRPRACEDQAVVDCEPERQATTLAHSKSWSPWPQPRHRLLRGTAPVACLDGRSRVIATASAQARPAVDA